MRYRKQYPIIFTTEMVRAILEGRKTQTRRIVKSNLVRYPNGIKPYTHKYHEGEILWVRETFGRKIWTYEYVYKADFPYGTGTVRKWKSPIFMPKNLSRITLIINDVRIEKLQNISEEDLRAEGIQFIENDYGCHQWTAGRGADDWYDYGESCYAELWDSIHKKENRWKDNPWVWVINFERINDR